MGDLIHLSSEQWFVVSTDRERVAGYDPPIFGMFLLFNINKNQYHWFSGNWTAYVIARNVDAFDDG